MTLSVALIVKEEQDFLPQCLNTVMGEADEIIVLIDDRTTDNSEEIAKEAGAKTFRFQWTDDYSEAKNKALEKVTSEWVLFLDADEIIKKEDMKKIKELLKDEDEKIKSKKEYVVAFILDQINYNNNEKTYGWKTTDNYADLGGDAKGYYSVPLVRLFKTGIGIKFKYKIHETVIDSINDLNGKIAKLQIGLHHYGDVRDEEFVRQKLERYDRMVQEQLKMFPGDPKAIFQEANRLYNLDETDRALLEYNRVIKLKPDYEMPYIMKGDIYVKQKKYWNAIQSYKRACEIAPKKPVGFIKLSALLTRLGKFEDAYRILAWANKFNLQDIALSNNLGFLLMQQKKYEEAVKVFTLGLNKIKNSGDPYYPIMINYLVDCLVHVDKRKVAIETLESVIKKNPRNVEIFKDKLEKIR